MGTKIGNIYIGVSPPNPEECKMWLNTQCNPFKMYGYCPETNAWKPMAAWESGIIDDNLSSSDLNPIETFFKEKETTSNENENQRDYFDFWKTHRNKKFYKDTFSTPSIWTHPETLEIRHIGKNSRDWKPICDFCITNNLGVNQYYNFNGYTTDKLLITINGSGNSPVDINEITVYDTNGNVIPYTIIDGYDSTTNGQPANWNNENWGKDNLNDGDRTYSADTSTRFFDDYGNGGENGDWAQILIDFGDRVNIGYIDISFGSNDGRNIPEQITFENGSGIDNLNGGDEPQDGSGFIVGIGGDGTIFTQPNGGSSSGLGGSSGSGDDDTENNGYWGRNFWYGDDEEINEENNNWTIIIHTSSGGNGEVWEIVSNCQQYNFAGQTINDIYINDDGTPSTRYLLVDVRGYSYIYELAFYDENDNYLNYNVVDSYNCDDNPSIGNATNLHDRNNSTYVRFCYHHYSGGDRRGFCRFIIDFGEIKNVKKVNILVGTNDNNDKKLPKSITFYACTSWDHDLNLYNESNENMLYIKKILYDRTRDPARINSWHILAVMKEEVVGNFEGIILETLYSNPKNVAIREINVYDQYGNEIDLLYTDSNTHVGQNKNYMVDNNINTVGYSILSTDTSTGGKQRILFKTNYEKTLICSIKIYVGVNENENTYPDRTYIYGVDDLDEYWKRANNIKTLFVNKHSSFLTEINKDEINYDDGNILGYKNIPEETDGYRYLIFEINEHATSAVAAMRDLIVYNNHDEYGFSINYDILDAYFETEDGQPNNWDDIKEYINDYLDTTNNYTYFDAQKTVFAIDLKQKYKFNKIYFHLGASENSTVTNNIPRNIRIFGTNNYNPSDLQHDYIDNYDYLGILLPFKVSSTGWKGIYVISEEELIYGKKRREVNGDIALFYGGAVGQDPVPISAITFFRISTPNSYYNTYANSLPRASYYSQGASNGINNKAIFFDLSNKDHLFSINIENIASNVTFFANFPTYSSDGNTAYGYLISNGTNDRCVMGTDGNHRTLFYTTISTNANFEVFGDLLTNSCYSGNSNGIHDRGIYITDPSDTLFERNIEAINIPTTGNSTLFGNLSLCKGNCVVTNDIYDEAIATYSWPTMSYHLERFNINTFNGTTDFGSTCLNTSHGGSNGIGNTAIYASRVDSGTCNVGSDVSYFSFTTSTVARVSFATLGSKDGGTDAQQRAVVTNGAL